jgi:hypothetical protein
MVVLWLVLSFYAAGNVSPSSEAKTSTNPLFPLEQTIPHLEKLTSEELEEFVETNAVLIAQNLGESVLHGHELELSLKILKIARDKGDMDAEVRQRLLDYFQTKNAKLGSVISEMLSFLQSEKWKDPLPSMDHQIILLTPPGQSDCWNISNTLCDNVYGKGQCYGITHTYLGLMSCAKFDKDLPKPSEKIMRHKLRQALVNHQDVIIGGYSSIKEFLKDRGAGVYDSDDSLGEVIHELQLKQRLFSTRALQIERTKDSYFSTAEIYSLLKKSKENIDRGNINGLTVGWPNPDNATHAVVLVGYEIEIGQDIPNALIVIDSNHPRELSKIVFMNAKRGTLISYTSAMAAYPDRSIFNDTLFNLIALNSMPASYLHVLQPRVIDGDYLPKLEAAAIMEKLSWPAQAQCAKP